MAEAWIPAVQTALTTFAASVAAGEPRALALAAGGALALGGLLGLFGGKRVDPKGKNVVISGCDTGFGNALAKQLAARGFTVFAGCLTPAGVAEVGAVSNVTAFLLDVTKEEDVAKAAALVSSKVTAIHALVNNAGIGLSGLVDWMPLSDYKRTMEVNFFGHVAMTKAFMTLLCAVPGSRVINVTSIAGILGAPGLSAYCASKFALEGFSDSLRREMSAFGLHTVIIEPSFLRTPIIQGAEGRLRAMWNACSEEVRARWGEEFFVNRAVKADSVQREAEDPQLAVDVMIEAITAAKPAIRYKAGSRAKYLYGPLTLLPAAVADFAVAAVNSAGTPPAALAKRKGQ